LRIFHFGFQRKDPGDSFLEFRQVSCLAPIWQRNCWWGGWGSNPRPADYEKCGPVLRVRYLHGYRRAVPPVDLIAQLARMARSTNRSTIAAPYPNILLLCVTSPRAPGSRRSERRHGLACLDARTECGAP